MVRPEDYQRNERTKEPWRRSASQVNNKTFYNRVVKCPGGPGFIHNLLVGSDSLARGHYCGHWKHCFNGADGTQAGSLCYATLRRRVVTSGARR